MLSPFHVSFRGQHVANSTEHESCIVYRRQIHQHGYHQVDAIHLWHRTQIPPGLFHKLTRPSYHGAVPHETLFHLLKLWWVYYSTAVCSIFSKVAVANSLFRTWLVAWSLPTQGVELNGSTRRTCPDLFVTRSLLPWRVDRIVPYPRAVCSFFPVWLSEVASDSCRRDHLLDVLARLGPMRDADGGKKQWLKHFLSYGPGPDLSSPYAT
jgi:hypothetical protein